MEENIFKIIESKMEDTVLNLYRQIIGVSNVSEDQKYKLYSNIVKNFETELTININTLDELEKDIKKEIVENYKDLLIYLLMSLMGYLVDEYNGLEEEICKQ